MASSSDDDFITVACRNPNPIQPATTTTTEILISVTNILTWDLPTILRHQTVKIQAHRNRLIQHSSYFHALLSGSFSESRLDCAAIEWNLETFLNILKCIYYCPLDVTSNNFLPLFEGALYFGVETLLTRCKTWFSMVVSLEVPPHIQLDDLISIWSFGSEHAPDFLPELCASYLARNFMWAISMNCFVDIPYDFLLSCMKHINLTVDSEMYLSDALLFWLDANTEGMEGLRRNEDVCTSILKQVRISLLPLWFAAVKRSSCHFSKFADASIDSIFRLLSLPSTGSIDALGDGLLQDLRIRLTKFSKKVNLSSCPQITLEVVLLSLLRSSNSIDYTLRNTELSPFNLERLDRNQCSVLLNSLPTLSFEAVQEVDISKCPRLHLETAIECFCKSFPSLRILKAAFLLNFKISTLRKLVKKCPSVCEVDLTIDTSPIISSQVSIVSSSPAITPQISKSSLNVGDRISFYNSGRSLSKLTLEGRSDLCDLDLQYISKFCVSLQYLNLKGCISLTDVAIASLLRRCNKLHSVLVCDTSFGTNSVLALCSSSPDHVDVQPIENEHLDSLALGLQTLHMGSCKCVDETSLQKLMSQMQKLKTLCLSDTHLSDGALYSFRGSSLEMLDVSNTMVSKAALAHLVGVNPGLKCLKARGCRNLSQQDSDSQKREFSSSYSCRELHNEIGRTCILNEISLGWGFSYSSLEALEPAITSLRKLTVGLGGSLGEDGLRKLSTICPMMESIILYFQVISDSAITNVMANLKNLIVLAFCHCLGDISILSFKFSMPNLRKLKLERVTPWMTNNDLVILTQSCANLVELSLVGCMLLNSESQQIISHGWPGLVSVHLQECGQVTTEGVCSLLGCKALEDLLLRHNGPGIQRSFIFDAASKLPMLRKLSLDLCDASEGDFDIPKYADRYSLTTVKIARCKLQKGLSVRFLEAHGRPVHKETLVLVWNSSTLIRTVVKERL